MKRRHIFTALFALGLGLLGGQALDAKKLVILHTNDTHSLIDADDTDGLGGVVRRKVVFDSVRAAEPNVMIIDAGDIVQGTLYFNLYKGEVEQKAMNALGYDMQVLGNHEFDNAMEGLAKMYAIAEPELVSTNYDMSKSILDGKFKRYLTRTFDGVKVGFLGINLQPKGMVAEGNYEGVEYLDAIEAANAAAWWLKNVDSCKVVVAVTHIGYNPQMPPGDLQLAAESSNIDVIIGGHSHDLINPADGKHKWLVPNRHGQDVLIAQAGKGAKNIGYIAIDLDDKSKEYKLIPVDSRLDDRIDVLMAELIAPYRAGVDSLMHHPIGRTARELDQKSDALLNWGSDVVLRRGRQLAEGVELGLLNKGGIRRGLPGGNISEGQIITMLPFNNRVQVIDIKGSDLRGAFEQMARTGGNGVSEGVEATFIPTVDGSSAVLGTVMINGKPLDDNKIYRVATIDYLANGGDYMSTLANHTLVAESPNVLYNDVLDYIRTLKNKKINPSDEKRFHPAE